MSPQDIIELALRCAELAEVANMPEIAHEMLPLASGLLKRMAPSLTKTGPAYVVTTDFNQAPCS